MYKDPKVFIVEDDAGVRDSLALLLELNGLKTACFGSAEAFLSSDRSEWVGCLVSDVDLPGMDGLQLAAAMDTCGTARLPVILMSGRADLRRSASAAGVRATRIIEKPINPDELIPAIRECLEGVVVRGENGRQS